MTLPGYTIAQTRREVGSMIAGGRRKWGIASPDHAVGEKPTPSINLLQWTADRYAGEPRRFDRWLDELLHNASSIQLVAFEEVRAHTGTLAAQVYGGFLAHLTAWCERNAVPYRGVPVATIKRHMTGKGNADKSTVIAAVRARGFKPADDNEADALAILLWAIDTHGGVR